MTREKKGSVGRCHRYPAIMGERHLVGGSYVPGEFGSRPQSDSRGGRTPRPNDGAEACRWRGRRYATQLAKPHDVEQEPLGGPGPGKEGRGERTKTQRQSTVAHGKEKAANFVPEIAYCSLRCDRQVVDRASNWFQTQDTVEAPP